MGSLWAARWSPESLPVTAVKPLQGSLEPSQPSHLCGPLVGSCRNLGTVGAEPPPVDLVVARGNALWREGAAALFVYSLFPALQSTTAPPPRPVAWPLKQQDKPTCPSPKGAALPSTLAVIISRTAQERNYTRRSGILLSCIATFVFPSPPSSTFLEAVACFSFFFLTSPYPNSRTLRWRVLATHDRFQTTNIPREDHYEYQSPRH